MEELHILSAEEKKLILNSIETNCKMVLPGEKSELDPVTVHIYQKEHHQDVHDCRVFQIRWGMHKIFQFKHLPESTDAKTEDTLSQIIKKNCSKIKNALLEHCQEILSDNITLQLEPELNRRNLFISSYTFKVCSTRKRNTHETNHGWPNFCLFLSWIDDTGEFQEFIHPLPFDELEKQFVITPHEIIDQFVKYRDAQF